MSNHHLALIQKTTSLIAAGDIVGAVTAIAGVSAADIGIIDIQETCSYVEILGDKGDLVLENLSRAKIKGKMYTIRQVGFRSKNY